MIFQKDIESIVSLGQTQENSHCTKCKFKIPNKQPRVISALVIPSPSLVVVC